MALDEKAERISLAIIRDSLDGKAEPLMTVETAARHMLHVPDCRAMHWSVN